MRGNSVHQVFTAIIVIVVGGLLNSFADAISICPTKVIATDGSGTIESPGYPAHYYSTYKCDLSIFIPEFSVIEFKTKGIFDVQQCYNSNYYPQYFRLILPSAEGNSYVRLCNQKKDGELIKRIETKEYPYIVYSEFRSTQSRRGHRFQLSYSVNSTISATIPTTRSSLLTTNHTSNKNSSASKAKTDKAVPCETDDTKTSMPQASGKATQIALISIGVAVVLLGAIIGAVIVVKRNIQNARSSEGNLERRNSLSSGGKVKEGDENQPSGRINLPGLTVTEEECTDSPYQLAEPIEEPGSRLSNSANEYSLAGPCGNYENFEVNRMNEKLGRKTEQSATDHQADMVDNDLYTS